MPGVTAGVYPGQQTAGTQVSSTYEGRHLTVREDELIHPFIADGFVNKGNPVIVCDAGVPTTFGNIVGVAFKSGAAAADLIPLDTEGIWNLTVYAEDDIGNSAIEIGDCLYIRAGSLPGAADADGTGDGEISKMNDAAHQIFFGYALGSMVAGGSGVIAVKVHAAPFPEMEERRYQTVLTGGLGNRHTGFLEAGASEGVGGYNDAQIDGQQTGLTYGWGFWIEPQAGWIGSASLLVGLDVGIYADDAANPALTTVYGFQYMSDWNIAPANMGVIRVNINQGRVANPMTYIWAFANPQSCGFIAAVTETDPPVGYVPWANIVGYGTLYIRLYADTD